VESVAWIAERKNLMAMLFYLLAADWFLRSDGAPRKMFWYAASLAAFLLALLSKGSVALLPVVLFGIVVARRRLAGRDFWRLAPFFVLGVGFAAWNVIYQNHHVSEAVRIASPLQRVLGAGAILWFYWGKALLPVDLCFVYPKWSIGSGQLAWWLPILAAVGVTAALAWVAWRRPAYRPFFFAWAYFAVSLVPVLGLVDVYFMKYSLVADHYQHLALIGAMALAGWGWARWRVRDRSPLPVAAAALVVVGLAGLTFVQGGNYRDSETLFRSVLRDNPAAGMAHVNRGMIELHDGRETLAQEDFAAALRLDPSDPEAHLDLGITLLHARRNDQAETECAAAVRLKPHFPEAHNAWGLALLNLGRNAEAARECGVAVVQRPNYPEAHNNLGLALAGLGRMDEAITEFGAAVRLRPDYRNAQENLGGALADQSKFAAAEEQFRAMIQEDPRRPDGYVDLGRCLLQQNRASDAGAALRRALELDPANGAAQELLAAARQLGAR